MILTYLLGSLPVSTWPARRWRFRLPDLGLFRCFLPALLRASLPLAVTRKRLRAPLWVFTFGIVVPLSESHFRDTRNREQGIEEKNGKPGALPCLLVPPRSQTLFGNEGNGQNPKSEARNPKQTPIRQNEAMTETGGSSASVIAWFGFRI